MLHQMLLLTIYYLQQKYDAPPTRQSPLDDKNSLLKNDNFTMEDFCISTVSVFETTFSIILYLLYLCSSNWDVAIEKIKDVVLCIPFNLVINYVDSSTWSSTHKDH